MSLKEWAKGCYNYVPNVRQLRTPAKQGYDPCKSALYTSYAVFFLQVPTLFNSRHCKIALKRFCIR